MRILEAELPTSDVPAAREFFTRVLDLAGSPDDDGVRIRAGTSTLRLRPAEHAAAHHVAFLVPAERFDAAVLRLRARIPLLTRNGEHEFAGPPGWRSRSVYFDGPEGWVLELIARLDLPPEPAGASGIASISEVGVVVPDVAASVRALDIDAAITPYANPPVADFAAMGDLEGLLILVPPGRAWFPTDDRSARESEVTLRVEGTRPVDLTLGRARVQVDPVPS